MVKQMGLLALLLVAGCAENPADKAPAAVVSSGTPVAPASATPMAGKRFVINSENSKVSFVGSKVTGKHDGGFKTINGEIGLVDNDVEKSKVHIDMDTDTVFADDEKLTGHLKSPDFFDAAKFPKSTFDSSEIKKSADGYTVSGDLTLHGVTQRISFPAKITVAPDSVKTTAEFSIDRMSFDMKYPGKADNLIRKEVLIKFDVNATPAP